MTSNNNNDWLSLIFSVGQKLRSILSGLFSLMVSIKVGGRCWLRLQLSKGLIRMENSFTGCLISHLWQIAAGCWLGASAALSMDLSSVLLVSLQHGGWLSPYRAIQKIKTETAIVCDLATEITHCYSYYILLVTQPTLLQCVRDYRGMWIPGGIIIMNHGMSWRFPTIANHYLLSLLYNPFSPWL